MGVIRSSRPYVKTASRRNIYLLCSTVAILVVGGLVACVAAITRNDGGNESPEKSRSVASAGPSHSPKPIVWGPTTERTFDGFGDNVTDQFQSDVNWKLTYTVDCTKWINAGHFSLTLFTGSEIDMKNPLPVNISVLKSKPKTISILGSGGSHYMVIDTEPACKWTLTVHGGDSASVPPHPSG